MFLHFVFSMNVVAPIFLLIGLGYLLRKTGFFTEKFISCGNKFVFYILLPVTLWESVFSADFSELAGVGFAAFAIGATVVSFAAVWAVARFFIKQKKILGVFVQGAFRSNMVFVGIPLMRNLAGEDGVAVFALIVALVMPLYNIFSILVLSACAESDEKLKVKTVALTVIKNPLVVAIICGFVLSSLNFEPPEMIARTLSDLSRMAGPLALICLGGGITFLGVDKKFKFALVSAILKVVVMPLAFTTAAFAFGFRGIDLAAFMVLGGTSSAIAGYTMAVQMGGDGYTAANIILFSTLLSAATLTIFIYALTAMCLI
ncbi:MAG: AEC family transporter [Defluviitaleaceae bacterium]|nr:AEC family transporter [Defluviitaleaceae bacterium]